MPIFGRGKKQYEDIEPKDAFTVLEKNRNNPDFEVLDVRTPEEYNEGHIENALLLNVKSKGFEDELDKLSKDKNYFVYCKSGRRSGKALELMEKHGFKNINNIVGGFDKWKSRRLPVEK
ncbi:rhodanese-related sulfurtransferase [Methanobacterium oryzae]